MVSTKYLDVVLLWYDIPFSVGNCQLWRRLSTPVKAWILRMSSKMHLTGCSRCHGGSEWSEWFEWNTLTLIYHDMTSHFQLTIVNSGAGCLPLLDDRSFKCLQRCIWRAVPGAMTALNGSNEIPWLCFTVIWHPIISSELQAVYPC